MVVLLNKIAESYRVCVFPAQGRSNKRKDYTVHGTQAEKVFNAFSAIAAILVCNTSGLLPEIQVGLPCMSTSLTPTCVDMFV